MRLILDNYSKKNLGCVFVFLFHIRFCGFISFFFLFYVFLCFVFLLIGFGQLKMLVKIIDSDVCVLFCFYLYFFIFSQFLLTRDGFHKSFVFCFLHVLLFSFIFFYYDFCGWKKVFLFKLDLSAFDGFVCLQKIDDIGWHFIDCGVVKLLNIIEGTSIVISDEVNSYSLTTESSTTSDSIQRERKK